MCAGRRRDFGRASMDGSVAAARGWARRAATAPIRLYRLALSPLLPASCRHWPSCSAYAVEAIERHGVRRGGWLALRRLGRCHPWGRGGFDPVPDLGGKTSAALGG